MKDGTSVIICCYNSASRLPETLNHLARQQTPHHLRWEVVVVDNASTDDTRGVAAESWSKLERGDVPLRITVQPIRGLSFARAKGIEIADYDTVIFCDDDNWLMPNYVSDAHRIMKMNPEIGALGGTGIPISDSSLPGWFEKYKYCFACYSQGDTDGELSAPGASLFGAGLVTRREILAELSARRFSPILSDRTGNRLVSGGDTELCYAIRLLGHKLWYSGKLRFKHYLPSTRLSEDYVFKLNESLSHCHSRLIVYTYVLQGKRASGYVWLKDVAFQLFYLCRSLIRFMAFADPPFERKLGVAFSLNSMIGVLHQFGKYRLLYKRIKRLQSTS